MLRLALVLACACRVDGVHFIGLGGDDAGNDGRIDAMLDAPSVPSHHAYLVDSSTGVLTLTRDDAGVLAFVGAPSAVPNATFGLRGPNNHLYVVFIVDTTSLVGAIRSFTIDSNGVPGSPIDTSLSNGNQSCTSARAALRPDGRELAVGCTNGVIALVPIAPDGTLGPAQIVTTMTPALVVPKNVAYSPDGQCLFVADETAVQPTIAFRDSPIQRIATGAGPTKPQGLAVDASYVYTAGINGIEVTPWSATCSLQNPMALILQDTADLALVTSQRLYVFGNEVTGFGTTMSFQPLPGSPYAIVSGATIAAAAVDPTLPTTMYLTSADFGGIMPASVDAVGRVTPSATIYASPTAPKPVWLVLGL